MKHKWTKHSAIDLMLVASSNNENVLVRGYPFWHTLKNIVLVYGHHDSAELLLQDIQIFSFTW